MMHDRREGSEEDCSGKSRQNCGHGHGRGPGARRGNGEGRGMYGHGKILGTTTVGERGQVVIPAEAREELDITAGDKFVVFGNKRKGSVIMVKADIFDKFADFFMTKSKKLERISQEILAYSQGSDNDDNDSEDFDDFAQEAEPETTATSSSDTSDSANETK